VVGLGVAGYEVAIQALARLAYPRAPR